VSKVILKVLRFIHWSRFCKTS